MLGSGLNPKCSLSPREWLVTAQAERALPCAWIKMLWGREYPPVVCLHEGVWVEKGKRNAKGCRKWLSVSS